jgi:3-phenylpropionate/cinnamic acid dioxygenase small subunit
VSASGPTPEELIRRTLARYCLFCDDGRFDEWGGLFTADARFHVMGHTHVGRPAVQAFIEAGQPPERRGKHVVANPLVLVAADATSARAWSDYVFLDRSGTISNTGRYHDHLVLGNDGEWRFALREIVFSGAGPELTDPPPST